MSLRFDEAAAAACLEVSERAYQLLRWLDRTVQRGLIPFDLAHRGLDATAAATLWLRRWQPMFPPAARAPEGRLDEFANYFSSYVLTSFDAVAAPGEIAVVDHCPCPWCVRIVAAPHFRPKKLTRRDKDDATGLVREALRDLADELGVAADRRDAVVDAAIEDATLAESAALYTWMCELRHRCRGRPSGPAVLALWRRFAWTPQGSPRKDFRLRPKHVLAAQAALVARLTG